MEERYIQPINAGHPKGLAGPPRPAANDNGGMGNAGMINHMGTLNLNTANSGAMPYMPNTINTGKMPELIPAKPNMVSMPNTINAPIIGAMPHMANPNMGMMPEMTPAKPNTGMIPEMAVKPDTNTEADMTGCGYKNGELPPCAPLAVGFVPFQAKNSPKYERADALTRGTLFPGLDLPFMNITNKSNPYAGTPMGELMALGFVIKELNLYLDTHTNDKDAFDMLKQLNKLMQEGTDKYVKLYGPQTIMDLMSGDTYNWIDNPWPWEYTGKGAADNHV